MLNGYAGAEPVAAVAAEALPIATVASRLHTRDNRLYTGADGSTHYVQPPRAELGARTHLTDAQKLQLFRDGYIILKGAVSKEITTAAKDAIKAADIA